MSLTYQDSAALMIDQVFVSRVQVACLTYAAYISNEDISTPAHNSRLRWAQTTMASPASVAASVAPVVVMDPQVQLDGSAITDPNLQTATEDAINKMM